MRVPHGRLAPAGILHHIHQALRPFRLPLQAAPTATPATAADDDGDAHGVTMTELDGVASPSVAPGSSNSSSKEEGARADKPALMPLEGLALADGGTMDIKMHSVDQQQQTPPQQQRQQQQQQQQQQRQQQEAGPSSVSRGRTRVTTRRHGPAKPVSFAAANSACPNAAAMDSYKNAGASSDEEQAHGSVLQRGGSTGGGRESSPDSITSRPVGNGRWGDGEEDDAGTSMMQQGVMMGHMHYLFAWQAGRVYCQKKLEYAA